MRTSPDPSPDEQGELMNVEEAADVDERRAIKKRRSALPLPHPGREAGDCAWEGGEGAGVGGGGGGEWE